MGLVILHISTENIIASQGNIGGNNITSTRYITGGSITTAWAVSAASVVATGGISCDTTTSNTLKTVVALINIKANLSSVRVTIALYILKHMEMSWHVGMICILMD